MHSFSTAKLANFLELSTLCCKKNQKKVFFNIPPAGLKTTPIIYEKKVVSLQIVMDSSRFIICRASAGSGKTYTLVRQYLLLAFSAGENELPVRFKRILAITFTNKAANEMKERILHELDRMADTGTASPMGKDIAEQLKLSDSTLRHHASIVRQAILHNYSDLAVCTIDSFMHRIVRTFAHDLNLPLNFDVQIDNDALIQSAVDDLMALAGTDGQQELTEMLCDFAESRMSDGKSYMIERELASLAQELFKEHTPQYLRLLRDTDSAEFRQIHRSMVAENRSYEQRLKTLGQKAVDTFTAQGLSDNDFYHGASGAGVYFRKLANGIIGEPNSYVLAYLEGDKLGSAKVSRSVVDALTQVKPLLISIYNEIGELRTAEETLYNTRQLLLKNLYSLALLNKLGQLVGQYSRDNEIVHISEFNRRISEVVQDEPAPFIYERIGNRYHNYLIDEFQDTSRLQWQNLVPLVENGVSSGHTSLVVGDGKQAIYRFRQGDVGQFIALPHVDNPVHGRLLEHPGTSSVTNLEYNFRTARAIVEFNNDFFAWAVRNRFTDNKDLQDIYIGSGEAPALVQTPLTEGVDIQAGFYDLDGDRTPLWDDMLADIQTLTDGQGYRFRDITVLARDNRTLGEISTHLTVHDIPVVSGESFLLSQSRAVMLMRNMLQYLLDSTDRVAAARVVLYLRSLGLSSCHIDTAFLNNRQPVDLDSLLEPDGIELNTALLRALDLYDCCEEMMRMLHLDNIETSYIATFLNNVAKYTNSHRHDLAEFIEWFDEQKDRLSTNTASDLDAVRLMTIHKAKGLEAPVVLYPILNKRDTQDDIWVQIDPGSGLPLPTGLVHPIQGKPSLFDEQYNEEKQKNDMDRINVLYVALTRPKEKLLLYCQTPPKENTTCYTALLHDYLSMRSDTREIRPGVIAIGDSSPASSPAASESPAAESISSIVFPTWASRIAIAEQSAQIFRQLDETAIRRGNQVHEVLALVHSTDDLDNALDTYTRRTRPDDETAAYLRQALHNMMAQPEVARFFNPQFPAKNECNIAWHNEVIRPDRIVYTPDCVWVIDYKTGQPKAEHQDQVLHYCDALSAMGHPTVKGYLIYLSADRCQVLPCL